MSSWSRRELRSVLAARRGQTEPIAALVAVLAIAVGLGLYAGVAADRAPSREETNAEATMQRVTAHALEDGVYRAETFANRDRYERPGETVHIRVDWSRGSFTTHGPDPPADADVARRPITYRLESGAQRPAVLTVRVWES